MNDGYNGWTNWDTWNAYLWLSNDEHSYKICRRYAEHPTFKATAWSLILEMGNPDKITKSNIDWDELEESFKDE